MSDQPSPEEPDGPTSESKKSMTEFKAVGSGRVLLRSLWIMAGLILAGMGCTATGIGAIFGIPMILLGLTAPLWLPFRLIKGECPYCATTLSAAKRQAAITCSTCEKRVLIKDKTFVIVE